MASKKTAAERAARQRRMERHVRNASMEELEGLWGRVGGPRTVLTAEAPGIVLPAPSCAMDMDTSMVLYKTTICVKTRATVFGETPKFPVPLTCEASSGDLLFHGSALLGPIAKRVGSGRSHSEDDALGWAASLADALETLCASDSPLKELVGAQIVAASPINEGSLFVQIEMVYPKALDTDYMVALLYENGLLTEGDLRGGEDWRGRPVDSGRFAGMGSLVGCPAPAIEASPQVAVRAKTGYGSVAEGDSGVVSSCPSSPAARYTRSQRGDVDLLVTDMGSVGPAVSQADACPTPAAPKLDYKYGEATAAVWDSQTKAKPKAALKPMGIDPEVLASIKAEEERLGVLKKGYGDRSREVRALQQSLYEQREKRELMKNQIEEQIKAASGSLPVRWGRLGGTFGCVAGALVGAVVCVCLGDAGFLQLLTGVVMLVLLAVGAVYLVGFLLSIIQTIATGIAAKNRIRKARLSGARRLKDIDARVGVITRDLAVAKSKEAAAKKAYEAQEAAVERARTDVGLKDGDCL